MKPILSVLVLSVSLLGLTACNKPQPAAPVPVVQVSQPQPSVVLPVQPTPAPSPSVIVTSQSLPKAVVAKKATHVAKKATSKKAEKDAYAVAFVNKLVYVCFERLYDILGTGPNAEELASIDANRRGFAFRCIQLQAVSLDDVSEFEGKL